jgi:hypothetical protein
MGCTCRGYDSMDDHILRNAYYRQHQQPGPSALSLPAISMAPPRRLSHATSPSSATPPTSIFPNLGGVDFDGKVVCHRWQLQPKPSGNAYPLGLGNEMKM